MTNKSEYLQKAVADLAIIRRAIGNAEDEEGASERSSQTTFGTNIMLQGAALFLAVIGVSVEIATGHESTRQFLASADNPFLQTVGLAQIALILAVLAGALYFLVYRAAKRSNKEFDRYVSRNFAYLKNLSFLSDLVIKFSVIAMLILAQRPEWVAPACMLFIGDYLIQGRFFTVPLIAALPMGAVCMVAAVAMFYFDSTLIILPMAAFAVVTAISLTQVVSLKKNTALESGV